MIIPIRCFTCGKTLADKYDYYIREAQKLEKTAASKPESAQSPAPHFDATHTGPILDALGLTRYCCRRHMLAQVDMMDTI